MTCGSSPSGKWEANLVRSKRTKNMSVLLYYYFPLSLFPVLHAWVCIKSILAIFCLPAGVYIYLSLSRCVCVFSLADRHDKDINNISKRERIGLSTASDRQGEKRSIALLLGKLNEWRKKASTHGAKINASFRWRLIVAQRLFSNLRR